MFSLVLESDFLKKGAMLIQYTEAKIWVGLFLKVSSVILDTVITLTRHTGKGMVGRQVGKIVYLIVDTDHPQLAVGKQGQGQRGLVEA